MASAASGRSSPTPTTPSAGSCPARGRRCGRGAGSPGGRPATSLVLEGTARRRQAGGPGPAGDQPAPRVHPYPHHHPRPPLRHDRGRKPGRCGDGPSRRPRAFRRGVYQAGVGRVRPVLAYKTSWAGGRLVVASAGSTSSKAHHGCLGYRADLTSRGVGLPQVWSRVDRNANAARNLRGPDRSPTGMSSGGGCRPGCRSWVTTAGELTLPRGRARDLRRPPPGGGGQ